MRLMDSEWLRPGLGLLLFAALSSVDQALVFFDARVSAVPLAGGIAFAIVHRFGYRTFVPIVVLSFVVSFWVTGTFSPAEAMIHALMAGAIAVIGVVAMRTAIGDRSPFAGTKNVIGFVLLGAGLPYLIGAVANDLIVSGMTDGRSAGSVNDVVTWWLGGAIGCIIAAPLPRLSIGRHATAGAIVEAFMLLAVGVCLAIVFAGMVDFSLDEMPLQYLAFPLLLWAVFRSGLSVAAFILTMATTATLWGTTEALGPFVRDTVTQTSLLLQAFFGLTGIVVLFLHAAMAERRAAESELRAARDELETRVEARTVDLQEAVREAEKANKTKSRFLAAASHDLRQPIHAIALFATALEARLAETQNVRLISRIQGSLTSLAGMLDGLLDMSRLENDAIVPQVRGFSIQDVFDEITSEFAGAAAAKNLEFRVVPSSMTFRSDRALLLRILGNLVGNAIRYTERGSILVGCRRQKDGGVVEVWDSGRGIAQKDVEDIFDPYRRLEKGQERAPDGLGLGLAIVDGIADLLGVDVAVRSVPDKGTVFSVHLPYGVKPAGRGTTAVHDAAFVPTFSGKTILAVDDDPDVLEGMNTVLSDWGCNVVTALDAEDALHAVTKLGAHLDLVISDFNLPDGQNGISFLEALRQSLERDVPAIIISGDTQPERRCEIEAAGYYLLTKPIQPASLRVLLRRLFRKGN